MQKIYKNVKLPHDLRTIEEEKCPNSEKVRKVKKAVSGVNCGIYEKIVAVNYIKTRNMAYFRGRT